MRSLVFTVLLAMYLSMTYANDLNNEYIYWMKAYVMAWHQYMPMRYLQQEANIIQAANDAVNSLNSNMISSLNRTMVFQTKELHTAQLMMAGTPAEPCVNGIADYILNAINEAYAAYSDCTADTRPNLSRQNNTLMAVRMNYIAAYNKAILGMDACVKTYPNKDSLDRLMSCVEAMNKNYFIVANATQNSVSPSPSMRYFQDNVVQCASSAFNTIITKGYNFLDMLVKCSALDHNMDPAAYRAQLSMWKADNDTMSQQIADAQKKNYNKVLEVESEMETYFNMQKDMLQSYVIESRDFLFYLNKIYSYVSDYYNSMTMALMDNPGDNYCVFSARSILDQTANSSASEVLSCDVSIVNNTKDLISNINDNFAALNQIMPAIGNAAIINCFSQGYIFAPDTILKYYNIVHTQFDIEKDTRDMSTNRDVCILSGYVASFFNSNTLPCGELILKKLYLSGEKALYNMERCLYISSGTEYSVTTPAPNSTT